MLKVVKEKMFVHMPRAEGLRNDKDLIRSGVILMIRSGVILKMMVLSM